MVLVSHESVAFAIVQTKGLPLTWLPVNDWLLPFLNTRQPRSKRILIQYINACAGQRLRLGLFHFGFNGHDNVARATGTELAYLLNRF